MGENWTRRLWRITHIGSFVVYFRMSCRVNVVTHTRTDPFMWPSIGRHTYLVKESVGTFRPIRTVDLDNRLPSDTHFWSCQQTLSRFSIFILMSFLITFYKEHVMMRWLLDTKFFTMYCWTFRCISLNLDDVLKVNR